MSRTIENTQYQMGYDWPEDIKVQGGDRGLVFAKSGSYRTAFVEAFPRGTFLRGEGPSLAEAEKDCWRQWNKMQACIQHGKWDRRHYRNGSAYCGNCGTWFSSVLPELSEDPEREAHFLEKILRGDVEELKNVLTEYSNAVKEDNKYRSEN